MMFFYNDNWRKVIVKHRKRINKRKVLFVFIICVLMIYSVIFVCQKVNGLLKGEIKYYSIVKKDINRDYLGIGQQKGQLNHGYYTTFQTVDQKVYKEYKQNLFPWKDHSYWQGTMEDNGCGITAMAILLSGYGIEKTPENLRKAYFPVLKSQDISKQFKSFGLNNSDFYYDSIHLSKDALKGHLLKNKPVLICVWNKPHDNRWTNASHYMVLLASTNNEVYISNPNGGQNDYHSSGWYDYDEVIPYIAKAMYIE